VISHRNNFVHFGILCLVPIFLLVLVLVSSFSDNSTCEGYEIASCKHEDRIFMNAFASRCICSAFEIKI